MSRYFLGSVPRDDPSPAAEEEEDSASDWSAVTPIKPRENIPSSERYESSDGHVSCILSPLNKDIIMTDMHCDEPPIPVVLDPTEILLRKYRPESFNNSATSSAANTTTTVKNSSAGSEGNNTSSNFTNNLSNNTTVSGDDPFVDAVCSTPKGQINNGQFEETTPTRAPPVVKPTEEAYKLSSSPPKAVLEKPQAAITTSIEGLNSQLDILDDLDDDDIDFALTQHTQKKKEAKAPLLKAAIKNEPTAKKETSTPVLKDIEDLQKIPVKLPSLSKITPLKGVKKVDVKSFIDDLEDEDFDSDLELEFTQLQAKKKPRLQTSRYKLVTDHVMSQRTHKENALPVDIDYKRDDVMRFRIVEVEEGPNQIALVVEDNKAQQHRVALRGCWMRAVPCVGDICHLIDESPSDEMDFDFEMDFDYIVDDMKTEMLFILNPDTLVTCTAVAEAHQCTRNVVLKDKMQGPRGIGSIFALLGVIIHETIQMCFGAVRYDAEFVESCAETVTKANMDGIMLSGESFESVFAKVKDKLPNIVAWFKEYMRQTPSAVAIENRTGKKRTLAITKVVDVEEEIWSPRYGIKGKIDATIEVREGNHRYLVPLEVKTGKSTTHIPHRSQTALYTLMLHDRYSCPIDFGVLYYSATSETLVIPAVKDEIHNLLAIRNEVASFMRQGARDMPDVIYDQSQCDRCFQKTECMVYYRLYDTYVKESKGEDGGATANKARFLQETEHVTEKDSQFFNHWDALLAKEGSDTAVLKREVWTMLSKDREKEGRCFSSMVIDNVEKSGSALWYTFKTPDGSEIPYQAVNISPGDRVVISDEAGHYCLAMGTLLGSSTETVRCALDRRLEFSLQKLQGFRDKDNQVFQSMLTHSSQSHAAPINFRFRIDRDDFAFGLGVARNNLFSLFAKHLETDENPQKIEQLRSWIVDLSPPQPVTGVPSVKLGKLNSDQTKAVHHIMNSKDYSLLLGMPGTGKTTTIAEIILELVKNGKTVLLSSFTHSAVDNILLKLMQHPSCDFDMLRLGSTSRIHPEVAEHYAANNRRNYETREEFEKLFLAPPVVGATALGIGDWVLQERHFDYCIVDEASQITLPFCLGPIRYADKFVLVGDHYQLTPIVKHPEAAGLRESLFKILCDAHPTQVVNLGIQYRMCADIMLLSNTLVYDGKLKCGNDEVANQSLAVPQLSKLRTLYADGLPNDDYLGHVLDPKRKVIFLNTDLVPAQETVAGDRIHNPTEAVIVGQIVEALCICGVEDSQIGCISQYRAQLKLINNELALRSGIEVMTADKFQGRDKDCIIVSLVRSNNEKRVGDLLKDWRRLNVAFTRSRSKLIVIGSRATLESFDLLKEFLRLIDDNGWMYSLPKDCTKMYSIAKQGTSPRKKQKRVGLSQRLIDSKPIMKNILEGL